MTGIQESEPLTLTRDGRVVAMVVPVERWYALLDRVEDQEAMIAALQTELMITQGNQRGFKPDEVWDEHQRQRETQARTGQMIAGRLPGRWVPSRPPAASEQAQAALKTVREMDSESEQEATLTMLSEVLGSAGPSSQEPSP